MILKIYNYISCSYLIRIYYIKKYLVDLLIFCITLQIFYRNMGISWHPLE